MELIFKIIPWALIITLGLLTLATTQISHLLRVKKDLEGELIEAGDELGKALKDRDKWERIATSPGFRPTNSSVSLYKSDTQKVIIKTELDRYHSMGEKEIEKEIEKGVYKFVSFIKPFIYSEIKEDEEGHKTLYQEIWVGLSEKFNIQN